MATQTEVTEAGDVLYMEGPNAYSRESVVIKTGETILVGSVLGTADSGATHEPLNADPTEPVDNNALYVALEAITTATAGQKCLVAARHCIVRKDSLDYGAGTSATVADAALEALGIIIRDEPDEIETQTT